MKDLFQKVGASFLFRKVVLFAIKFNKAIYGALSRLRMGAIFPESVKQDCYINLTAVIKHPENIHIGHGLRVGPECVLGAMGGIFLGDYVRISKGVTIETGGLDISAEPPYTHVAKPIVIESGVWIGTNAIILGGVTIGQNSVIAAGAIVTKNVPENTIFGGNPAKMIRRRIT